MKFLQKTFTVPVGESQAYRDNYEKTFGKKKPKKQPPAAKAKGKKA